MAPLPTQSISHQTERQPLRRATYVHVSDLISAYNIDHIRLEREIARVNAKRSKFLHTSGNDNPTSSDKIGPEKTDLSHGTEITGACSRDSSSDGHSDGVPAPHEDGGIEGSTVPQKRLQPPRGGFNLCV